MQSSIGRTLVLPGVLASLAAVNVLCQQQPPDYDVLPPVLSSVTFKPTQVNTAVPPPPIGLTATARDPLSGEPYGVQAGVASGLSYIRVTFSSPSKNHTMYAYLNPNPNDLFTPGQSQTLIGSLPIATNAETGNWTVQEVYLSDKVGNYISVLATDPLINSLPSLTVTSIPDLNPPVLEHLTVSTSAVDVTNTPATLTFNARITDDLSGVSYSYVYIYQSVVISPTKTQYYSNRAYFNSIGSNDYQAVIDVPRFSPPGNWSIEVYVQDVVGNGSWYNSVDLLKLAFPSSLMIHNGGQVDLTPAAIQSLTINNDSGLSDNNIVPVTMITSDDISGASRGSLPCGSPWISLTSPGGAGIASQSQTAYFQADDSTNTHWHTRLFFPQYSQPGTWQATVNLCDNVGNNAYYDSNALSKAGIHGEFYLLYPSKPSAGQLTPTDRTIQDPDSQTQISVPAGLDIKPATGPPVTNPTVSIETAPNILPDTPFASNDSANISISFTDPVSNTKIDAPTLDPPGATITIPLLATDAHPPGPAGPPAPDPLVLYHLEGTVWAQVLPCKGTDPATNMPYDLNPIVNADRTATFSHICSFSIFRIVQLKRIPGDVNDDGVVDCKDVSIVRAALGSENPSADVNGDGIVNVWDLAYVLGHLALGASCH